MKTKPIHFAIASGILLAVLFLFSSCHHKEKDEKGEIIRFLFSFSYKLNKGDAAALQDIIAVKMSPKALKKLMTLLTGKKETDSKETLLANVSLDIEASDIKTLNDSLILAVVPAELTQLNFEKKISSISIKIRKVSGTQLKIVQIDAKKLISDYKDYAALIKSKTSINQDMINSDLFEPKTIAAFKTAEQLKSKYDSVIWFTYNNDKTYYYVLKGKWDLYKDLDNQHNNNGEVKDDYKMGLVGPDLKEIIPVGYTLIHNIGTTISNLIEVENGDNKGLFDLKGKEVVPAKYNRIYPIDDDNNLAVLQNGLDYYYLKKDFSISAKADIKLADFFSKIKKINTANDLKKEAFNNITEYNSTADNGTVYLPPSYLVDLNLVKKVLDFPSPTRAKNGQEDFGQTEYSITAAEKIESAENWFQAFFYAIKDYYLDARAEFYDGKGVVIVDKKKNRVFTQSMADNYYITDLEENGGEYEGLCNINSIRAINDTLFEVKAGANLRFDLYDATKTISGGPYYHYYSIEGNNLVELPNRRNFGFTKYIKMDDSYLSGCYTMIVGKSENNNGQTRTIDGINADMLRFMKNEIYADYNYQFKDNRWKDVFYKFEYKNTGEDEKPLNVKVDEYLTPIDKYNINWIVQKLKGLKAKPQTPAAK